MLEIDKSKKLFSAARQLMPGGVNSPVRAFKAVDMNPVFIDKGQGARVYDVDGHEYIDYVCSWGPLILGHADADVVAAIKEAAGKGTSFGAPCAAEVELARLICEAIPSIEKVRMVNSGTEATMSAIRLARAFTGKEKIIKFEGCYHGHADSFLIKAGSGLLTAGVPTSPGIPAAFADNTLVARYNDLESVENLFKQCGESIAAVIVEPVAGNMGLVMPENGFLEGLRNITCQYGSLLIFDEVITGFRVCYGGYQNYADIQPDLTTLGKIIGGGLPVGAYGGKKQIMDLVAPEGSVYQAGTLSGNPLAMAAGIAALSKLKSGNYYQEMNSLCTRLTAGLDEIFNRHGVAHVINRLGSMFCIFFTGASEVKDYQNVMTCDTGEYAVFFREMLEKGVYLPPAQFEVCFVSAAHTPVELDKTLSCVEQALYNLRRRRSNDE